MGKSNFELVREAAARIAGHANRTPVATSSTLNRMIGAEVFFKCENFQKVGAFKFRGAYNAVSRLSEEQKARGIIAYSSGNHAQAIALVGKMMNLKTVVVMPDDAPETKRRATEEYGAQVIGYDPQKADRAEIAETLRQKHGYTLIPPFDHMDIVAGQGTAALELLEETGPLESLLVPCGGAGLLSGSAIAAKGLAPDCRVIGVEPELADDAARSFRTGTLHTVKNPPTIADGTRTSCLGKITFPLVLQYVDDFVTVSEESIMEAVRFLFYRMKLVVEPSGALGLSALLERKEKARGRIGVILSGGNIDAPTMKAILK